ncbi:SDR family NAD(P)-dependent oxidoreductase [Streptomyces rubiginosohelvolus]|uniref:SDR family NAD(P)-dependent oxidoreductase n=1 Tax=Streptomyces rubiginosohelvolus TaxID=67362 RepID=UPI0037179CA3
MVATMSPTHAAPTTVVLTGATSGIGQSVAHQLATRVDRLILHGPQNHSDMAPFIALLKDHDTADVHYIAADFDQLATVEALADQITDITGHVDVLINNAGRPGPPARQTSADGNELTLQTNYLAPVLLTRRLTPLLTEVDGRVVHVSSATHLSATLDPDDLNMNRTPYGPTEAYSRSKLALVAHARWLVDQSPRPRPDAVSLHPGVISTTLLHAMFDIRGDSAAHGARNVAKAALSASKWAGKYLDENQPEQPNPVTLDPGFRNRLMNQTFQLIDSRSFD